MVSRCRTSTTAAIATHATSSPTPAKFLDRTCVLVRIGRRSQGIDHLRGASNPAARARKGLPSGHLTLPVPNPPRERPMKPRSENRVPDPFRQILLCAALALGIAACEGSDGSRGPAGPPGGGGGATNTVLSQGDDLPGVNVEVTGLSGGSAPGGRFAVGDVITVAFTVQKNDGSDWDIGEMSLARTLVSGPTFNYQRVLAEQSDVATR